MNYLPLKLEKLRKHYNYSQSYLAGVLNIDVVDYMGLENGRNMINYAQAKKLASLYHIDIDEIFLNSEDVTLYDVGESDTDKINIEYFIPKKNIIQKAKEKPLLAGAIVGIVIATIVISIIAISNKNRPYVSYADNTDRLSVSNTSLIYIDNLGAVKGAGNNDNGQISNLPSEHASKVCEGSDFSLILLDDGKVLSQGLATNYQKEINKWDNIIDIACGDKHAIGVDNKGKVYCVGDNSLSQLEVSEFSDIKNIYATPNGTIGVANDGTVYYTGTFVGTSTLKKYSKIKDLDASENNLIILKEDGTCDYVASYDNSVYFAITKWQDIIDVTCGNDFFAGLKSDGTVLVASIGLDENKVSKWNSIIAIDSGDDYLIGFDSKEIKGVGKNTYHQFNDDQAKKQTLAKVQNIIIDYDNERVTVKFDEVKNASGYLVNLIVNEETILSKKVSTNEWVNFSTEYLKDNNMYKIQVTALGDNSKYEDALVADSDFVFLKEVNETMEEKMKIRNDVAGSNKDDFETYLRGLGVEDIEAIEINDCSTDNSVIDINGVTPGQTYRQSELKNRKVSYTYCKLIMEEANDEQNLEN